MFFGLAKAFRGSVVAALALVPVFIADHGAAASPLMSDPAPATAGQAPDSLDQYFAGNDAEWNQFLSINTFGPADLQIDRASVGLHQVARSLIDNDGLQQVLSDTKALQTQGPGQEDGFPGTTGLGGNPSRAAAAAQNRRPSALPPTDEERFAAAEAASDPDSLRNTLRDLVAVKRAQSAQGPGTARADGDDDSMFGIGEALRDNRLLGEALNTFIRRTDGTDFEPTFSILGVGQFSFEVSSDLRNVNLTEGTTGLSLTLDNASPAPPEEPAVKVDIYAMIRAFLATTTGTLSMIAGCVLLFIWGMVRMASALRR
jgi:hypothetical protein